MAENYDLSDLGGTVVAVSGQPQWPAGSGKARIETDQQYNLSDLGGQFVSSKADDPEYNKKVSLFYNWLKTAPPEEREGSALTRFTNPLGLRKWLSKKFGTGEESAWFDALDIYVGELSWTNPEKWKHFLVGAEQAALTFKGLGAAGVPGVVPKFAAYEAIQAPREGETLLQRGEEIGKGAAFGYGIGLAGKYIPKARFRIPTTVGGAMLVTAVGGGSAKQILDNGAQMFGWECISLAQQGADRIAVIKAARKFNPELSKVPTDEIVQNANQMADIQRNLPPTIAAKPLVEAVGAKIIAEPPVTAPPAREVPAAPETKTLPIAQSPEVSSVTANIPPLETRPTTAGIPPKELPVPSVGRITPRPVPPIGGKKERAFITSVKEEFPEMDTRIAGQYYPRSTDKLSIKAKNLIRDDINAAEDYVRKNADDTAIATTCELIKHYNEQAQQATSEAVRNTLYDKAAEITNVQARQLTELGRSVQAASILGRLTPEGQLRFAAKIINDYNEQLTKRPAGILRLQKRVPNLTTEQTKEILTRAKTIQNMPDGSTKAQTWWELQNYISDLVPVPLYRAIINTWKAGLLTGIKTHGLNTTANLAHGVTESVKDIPGVAVDSVAALFTGERKLALTERGLYGGTREGFNKGWRYVKTGYDERNVGVKYDYRRGSYGKSKFARWVQAYDESVFDLMGAEDQPFYYGAKSRSLYSQAAAKAINQGVRGAERQAFINNLIQNPTDDMIKYATIDAEVSIFTNKTAIGIAARAWQKIPLIGEISLPFARTPSAIATQIINYSPIGIPKTVIENIGRGRFDQRLFSQGMGRAITGTAAMAIGVALYKAGLLSLDRPKSEREQKLWELEGRKENSIKIGNKWRSVTTLGPVGNVLVIGGLFQNALETSGSPTEAIVKVLAGAGKSFSEQTFLRGVSQAVDALTDPARSWEVFFSNLAGSTVPTIVADTARAMDSVERRAVGPIQKMKGRIPVLREQLEPKVNVFGQDLPRYGGNPLEVMIDPTRPVKIKQDVVVDELRRLWDVNIKVSPTLLGDRNGYEGLIPEQNTQLWHRAGQLTYFGIFNLIQLPEYRKSTDEEKGKLVESFVDDAKNIARAEIVLETSNQLSDIPKLIELRKTGLLTAEVGRLLALTRMDMSILMQLSQGKTVPQTEPLPAEQSSESLGFLKRTTR